MLDSQSREPGFESSLCYRFNFSTVWAFSFSPQCLSPLSCINEYLTIDSGGNVSGLSSRVIAAWLECFPEKLGCCRNEQVCQGVKCKVLAGLDTALYKDVTLAFFLTLVMSLLCSCFSTIPVDWFFFSPSAHASYCAESGKKSCTKLLTNDVWNLSVNFQGTTPGNISAASRMISKRESSPAWQRTCNRLTHQWSVSTSVYSQVRH